MAPVVIGVGGAHSGSGKTRVACRILERFPGWGAIKCTPTLLYTSIVDDPQTLGLPDKDTALMMEAGAGEALWVQSTGEDMQETLRMAVDRLSHLDGIVVEGNSAIEVLSPDIVIFIAGDSGRFKKSAATVLRMADLVISSDKFPPEGAPPGAALFDPEDVEGYLGYIIKAVDERQSKGRA